MSLRVALVGFGLSGRILHAPLIRAAGLVVGGVVSRRRDEVAALLPDACCHDTLPALLAAAAPELVVVCSPNHLHREHCLQALAAGCHVIVEKPMTRDVREADELIAAARAARRELMVFHNRRWDSDLLALRALLQAGRLGELQALQLRWDRFRPERVERWREQPQCGGGVLNDLGAHLLDQVLYLLGPPQRLWADVFAQRAGATVDDGFDLHMQCGAVRVTLGVSSMAVDPGLRIRALGSAASFTSGVPDVQEAQLRAGLDPLSPAFGVPAVEDAGRLRRRDAAQSEALPLPRGEWLQFYRQAVACIVRGGPAPVSGVEGRKVMQLIEAARRSSQSGCRVELPARPGQYPG
ncbi:MAG: Gfo/Idh/MocA family oxidoreductase [Steroidobacteraceae bacterium]